MSKHYTIRTKEEKLSIVNEVMSGKSVRAWEPEIHHQTIRQWVEKYEQYGEAGLEVKRKPGNPLSRYERRKELTYEEQLQYQIELLKRELVKKEAEVLRLKKLNERKGGGAQRR